MQTHSEESLVHTFLLLHANSPQRVGPLISLLCREGPGKPAAGYFSVMCTFLQFLLNCPCVFCMYMHSFLLQSFQLQDSMIIPLDRKRIKKIPEAERDCRNNGLQLSHFTDHKRVKSRNNFPLCIS